MAVAGFNHPWRRAGSNAARQAIGVPSNPVRTEHRLDLARDCALREIVGMSVETLYSLRRAEPAFRDLDCVVLLDQALTDDGDTMPAGSEGTVVYVTPDARTLIVEFAQPEGALATIPAESAVLA